MFGRVMLEIADNSPAMEKKTKVKEKDENAPIMHGFEKTQTPFSSMKIIIISVIAVILLGVGSGYFLAKSGNGDANSTLVGKMVNKSSISAGKTLGDGDPAIYKDTAEGVLKEGGIEGEGQFHLERPGGESQYVYMTSGTVDLSQLIDRKIKVWGQTQKAQTAGWLMDVGKVEVLQ